MGLQFLEQLCRGMARLICFNALQQQNAFDVFFYGLFAGPKRLRYERSPEGHARGNIIAVCDVAEAAQSDVVQVGVPQFRSEHTSILDCGTDSSRKALPTPASVSTLDALRRDVDNGIRCIL